ncbi:MAG: MFS transporter [Bacteroidetes bacterium]|nr:MFS transporter [Bacteroidota bacterium]
MCTLFFFIMKSVISAYDQRFWILCLSSFFYFLSFNLIIPQLPEILSDLGGAKFKGLIIGLFALSAMSTRPFSGKLIEMVGRKPLITTGVIISTFVCVLYPFTGYFPFIGGVAGFLFLRFLHGFSAGCTPTGTTAYVADIVPPERRGEAMGILGMANNLGMSLGPAIGGEVAIQAGNPYMFGTAAFFSFVTIIALVRLPETHKFTHRFRWSFLKLKWADVFEPRVALQGALMVLSVASFGAVLTLIPDYCDSLGIKRRGLFFSVLTGTSLMIRFTGGRWSDIRGREYVMSIGLILLLVADLMLILFHNTTVFYLSAAVFGMATGLNSPTIFAWVIDKSDPKAMGRAISTLFICLEFGIILGSVIPAAIYQNTYSRLPLAFLFPLVLSVVSVILLAWNNRMRKMSS